MLPRSKLCLSAIALFGLSLPASAQSPNAGATSPQPASATGENWVLQSTFSDEFDGPTLDSAKWNSDPRDWDDWSWEPENAFVEGGVLKLRMQYKEHQRKNKTLFYTSGMIQSKAPPIKYGYFEARLKATSRYPGTCPAFWAWRGEKDSWTEIDFVELLQQGHRVNAVDNCTHVFRHPNLPPTKQLRELRGWRAPWDPRDDFHVYGCEWSPGEIVWYVDGKPVNTRKNEFWHQPLDVALSLGVRPPLRGMRTKGVAGGRAPGQPSAEGFPTTFETDYVRVWQKPAASTKPTETKAAATKPNVLFILVDDLRPDGLHALGNAVVKTPNMDRLVDRGFVFRNAYTMGSGSEAVCLPSRTQTLSGMSMFRAQDASSGPTPDEYTFPKALREAGYATFHAGKFGNSPKEITKEFNVSVDAGNAEQNVDKVIAFLHKNAGQKPWFVYLAGREPHDPQYAPDNYYAMYKAEDIPLPPNFLPYHPFDNGEMKVRDEQTLPWPRTKTDVTGKLARYYASITYLDDQIGRVIKTLEELGQRDNTIVVFAGDNGLSLGEHGLLGKQNLYEFGGMHVPLAFAGPGIAKGESNALVYLYDIFPTVCQLTRTPKPGRVDGKSLAPIVTGEVPKVRDYALTAYKDVQRAVRDDRWKLIRYPRINKSQLFDLKSDPHEMNDLADKPEYADKLKEMMALLEKAQSEAGGACPLSSEHPTDAAWSPEKIRHKPGTAKAKK